MEYNFFEQSTNLITKAAYAYYIESLSQGEIAQRLGISGPTISRLLKKAKQQGIIRFSIPDAYLECIELEQVLQRKLKIREVIVAPTEADANPDDPRSAKKIVAVEGSRYLQRIVTNQDTLGIAWGRTIQFLINSFNPCLKKNVPFISLHGDISDTDSTLDPVRLSSRMAMSFGGGKEILYSRGLLGKNVEHYRETALPAEAMEKFKKCTISVSGAGSFFPLLDSPLQKILTEEQIQELIGLNVCGDLMLHFIDSDGNECDSSLKNSYVGIDLETYRQIPTKIIVASGAFKASTIRAHIKGGYVDVLIIGQELARELAKDT